MSYHQQFLKDKVAIISGGSRGIGAETARKLAQNGCHVVITGKTAQTHPKLEGTIHSVAEECKSFGVEALPLICDVRDEKQITSVISQTIKQFGQIDILINSASAISLTNSYNTTTKQFDLMHEINVRGTYLMSRHAIPYLKLSDNAHIVNFAPPLTINANFFLHLGPYAMSKYGMSMCTLSMAQEYYHDDIAVNSLWPRTIIKTAATQNLNRPIPEKYMRKPSIMADAVLEIVSKPTRVCTGCFLIDDLVLTGAGVTDFDQYACEAGNPLIKDLFLPHDLPPPPEGVQLRDMGV